MRFHRLFILICLMLGLLVTACPLMAAEGGSGDADEHHVSILHGLFKIPLVARIIPQAPKMPDLVLQTYFLAALIVLFFSLISRNLSWIPHTRAQGVLEVAVEAVDGFFGDILGGAGRKYAPFVGAYFSSILMMNLMGLLPGFQSPTADLNTTLASALLAVGGVQVIAIREVGFAGYVRHYVGDPVWLGPLNIPIHIIGEAAKVLSLSLRLFGNIFSEEMVIIVLAGLSPVLLLGIHEIPYLPLQLPMVIFGLYTSFLQALIFSVLTSIYIAMFLEGHHAESGHR